MKTQGEIEAPVCEGISRFEQDYMGRGPKDIHTHLISDLLVVRLHGVLTAAEQQLKVLSVHHDISTVTGEEVVLFTLAKSPLVRETKKK